MSDVKRIIVFGATGKTGSKILKRAIAEGLEVTAYVRTPSKIPENVREELHKVIKGDIYDKQAIEDAVQGHDAVLSALGGKITFAEDKTMSEPCANIIAGMKKHNMRNLVVISGAVQLAEEMPVRKFLMNNLMGSFADHRLMIEYLEADSNHIDWIVVMPPMIQDNDFVDPNYMVTKDRNPGVFSVSSAEIADFMISIITDETKLKSYRHCKIGISSHAKTSSSSGYKIGVGIALLAVTVGAVVYYNR